MPNETDSDRDLLADERPEAISNHAGNFRGEEEALEKEFHALYKGGQGEFQNTPGFVPGRYLMRAIKCASWASHEDVRQFRHRMVDATLRTGKRLVEANKQAAADVVGQIKALKEASDATTKNLVKATWVLAFATIGLAVATVVLVLVEAFKH